MMDFCGFEKFPASRIAIWRGVRTTNAPKAAPVPEAFRATGTVDELRRDRISRADRHRRSPHEARRK